jgi:XTP/dITP diphosphohydrolase
MGWVIATGNPGKRREFEHLLGEGWGEINGDLSDYPDMASVIEDGQTFAENAVKKAVEVSVYSELCALADDSGLEVDALDGRPGIYSARFAGEEATDEDNNRTLIEALKDVTMDKRGAQYVAVIAIAMPESAYHELQAGVKWTDLPVTFGEEGQFFLHSNRAVVWFRDTCRGRIIDTPRGSRGFGYDPYFVIDDWGLTLAEVSLDRKNTRSHRAGAVCKLKSHLASLS